MKCRVAINKHKESFCYLIDYVIESKVSDSFLSNFSFFTKTCFELYFWEVCMNF